LGLKLSLHLIVAITKYIMITKIRRGGVIKYFTESFKGQSRKVSRG
jgi:hypothetical protein